MTTTQPIIEFNINKPGGDLHISECDLKHLQYEKHATFVNNKFVSRGTLYQRFDGI